MHILIRVSLETRAVLITNLRPRTINSEQLPTRVARDVRQPPLHALAGEGPGAVNAVGPATVFTKKSKSKNSSVYRKNNSVSMKTSLGEQCLQNFQQHSLQKKHYSPRTLFTGKNTPVAGTASLSHGPSVATCLPVVVFDVHCRNSLRGA